jgi:GNAT superfamily N-acetyltransferase
VTDQSAQADFVWLLPRIHSPLPKSCRALAEPLPSPAWVPAESLPAYTRVPLAPAGSNPHHPDMITLRLATPDDLPALQALIPESVRALSQGYYTPEQVESAIRHVFGPDTQLIADGTYFAAEAEGMIAGCGGWSRRRTLYGGDQMKEAEDPLLDPATEAAKIRAFFVHPRWARRGIASMIMEACRAAAAQAGFQRLELMATLPGEPLYRAFGFEVRERVETTLPDGVRVPFVRMDRPIGG